MYRNEDMGVKIQCPDCGTLLELTLMGEYFCAECDRVLPESEIRERCGL